MLRASDRSAFSESLVPRWFESTLESTQCCQKKIPMYPTTLAILRSVADGSCRRKMRCRLRTKLGAPSKSQAQRKNQIATKIRPSTPLNVIQTFLQSAFRSLDFYKRQQPVFQVQMHVRRRVPFLKIVPLNAMLVKLGIAKPQLFFSQVTHLFTPIAVWRS